MTTSAPFAVDVYFQGNDAGLGPRTPLPGPNVFCLTEREFMHAVLTLDYWGGDATAQSLVSGTPIQVNFGRPPQMRIFYGYVNHVGRTNDQTSKTREGRNAICVYCVGASWPLKQRDIANYANQTNTQIISDVATQFHLGSYVVPFYGNTGDQKLQGGLSYWEFCVQLVQEIGYTFYCSGIQLVAKPRNTDPNNLTSQPILFDYAKNPAALPVFNPVLGSNSPAGGQLRNRVIGGIDMITLQPFILNVSGSNTSQVLGVTQETPPFTEIEQFTTHSPAQATSKLQGMAQANQMYLTATAVGVGNPQISCGQLIYVQNANGSQNGLWFVTEAVHTITQENYVLHMTLGRDSLGQTATTAIIPQTSFPEELAQLVGPTYSNSYWSAIGDPA
jgi:hypothetical protein